MGFCGVWRRYSFVSVLWLYACKHTAPSQQLCTSAVHCLSHAYEGSNILRASKILRQAVQRAWLCKVGCASESHRGRGAHGLFSHLTLVHIPWRLVEVREGSEIGDVGQHTAGAKLFVREVQSRRPTHTPIWAPANTQQPYSLAAKFYRTIKFTFVFQPSDAKSFSPTHRNKSN